MDADHRPVRGRTAIAWALALLAAAPGGVETARAEAPYQVAWCRQLGTSSDEMARSVAVGDSGGAFACGYTGRDLYGTSAGLLDCFLVKYDTNGNLLWGRQFGTRTVDHAWCVAADGWVSSATATAWRRSSNVASRRCRTPTVRRTSVRSTISA